MGGVRDFYPKILTSKYKNHTAKQIASDFLPDRSVPQIKDKLKRMRITKSMWTDEELDLLVEHGGKLSPKEIAKQLLRRHTIRSSKLSETRLLKLWCRSELCLSGNDPS